VLVCVSTSAVARNAPSFTSLSRNTIPARKAHLAAQGTALAGSVELELDDYLDCGRPEHRFLRGRCDTCHAEHLVAVRASNAWLLPELRARRMREGAALRRAGCNPSSAGQARVGG